MPDTDQRSPLTLEDLLRLKRAERPAPEFWDRFERELRQKQLAALMERRPWWQTLPQIILQRRALMPLGATAILAFTLVSVRFYVPGQLAETKPVGSEQNAFSAQVALASQVVPLVATPVPSDAPVSIVDLSQHNNPDLVAEVSLSERLPDRATEFIPWGASQPVPSPSEKFLVVNLESAVPSVPAIGQPAFQGNSVPTVVARQQKSTEAAAELASVTAQSSTRNRLLAQFSDRQFTPEPQAPASIRERLTRRLASADASLAEHISRVGLKGDQVSLRF